MTHKTNQNLKVLIYRRTHTADPCQCGVFGIRDCMGAFRSWDYDAVIGIGAKNAAANNISYKLTWVGINPHKHNSLTTRIDKKCKYRKCKEVDIKDQLRAPRITFDHFCLMNGNGLRLCDCAPLLYQHMFTHKKIPRAALSTSRPEDIQKEVTNLVNQYQNCLPSQEECQCKQY